MRLKNCKVCFLDKIVGEEIGHNRAKCNSCRNAERKQKRFNEANGIVIIIEPKTTKICTKCGIEKSFDCFYFRKKRNCYESECKNCNKTIQSNYNKNNKNKKSEYYKKYREKNKKKIAKKQLERTNNLLKNDPEFKLRFRMSGAIRDGLNARGASKRGKSILDSLPYTIPELRSYLETQFETWMTWENHGKYDPKTWNDNDQSTWIWQIDHIVPHSEFRYSSMEDEDFQKCWALSNLRPYNAKQNILDGASKIRHSKKSTNIT